jgi:hypothetical protein
MPLCRNISALLANYANILFLDCFEGQDRVFTISNGPPCHDEGLAFGLRPGLVVGPTSIAGNFTAVYLHVPQCCKRGKEC